MIILPNFSYLFSYAYGLSRLYSLILGKRNRAQAPLDGSSSHLSTWDEALTFHLIWLSGDEFHLY